MKSRDTSTGKTRPVLTAVTTEQIIDGFSYANQNEDYDNYSIHPKIRINKNIMNYDVRSSVMVPASPIMISTGHQTHSAVQLNNIGQQLQEELNSEIAKE